MTPRLVRMLVWDIIVLTLIGTAVYVASPLWMS